MLNGIHLVDYGNHRDTRVSFGRMTALVGQNGSGKTNLLRGILEVGQRAFSNSRDKTHDGHERIRSGTSEWHISASWPGSLIFNDDEKDGNWAVKITSSTQTEPPWIWHEGMMDRNSWMPHPTDDWQKFPIWQDPRLLSLFGEKPVAIEPSVTIRPKKSRLAGLWLSQYFKTAGSYLQGPSYSEKVAPTLSEDCRDLAWVIAYLKGDKDEVFSAITEALQKVVPTFRRVKHRPVAIKRLEKREVVINKQQRLYDEEQKVMGQELRFDMASGTDLPASSISEGTLVSLAVLTAIIHNDSLEGGTFGSKTVLLDDIESGLHPSAQRDLVRQLRYLQEKQPGLQIIFSSHSPYIIDEMQPEDVWLFAPDKDGIAHCAKLSEHPDAKRALGVLTTGEFWSAEGESWVLDSKQRTIEEIVAVK